MLNAPIKYLSHFSLLLLSCFSLMAQAAPEKPISYDDPWERMNRAIFSFNDTLDTYALKPVAKGYDTVTPKPVQTGVSNFFNNIGEIRNTLNAAFQLKGVAALTSLTRLAVNSTVGVLGVFDVASSMGIETKYQDFGITLAEWGVPSGPYVMLPFFGPRTLRGSVGGVPDAYFSPLYSANPESMRWTAIGVKAVNTRADLLKSEDLIMGDRYSFIRDAYLQNREFIITGKPPEDDF